MASYTLENPKFKTSANQVVDDAISYYQSPERKRIALRRALQATPDDPRLKQIQQKLTNPKQVEQAAQAGVFLNYSRADELFVLELADNLRDMGINVWLDMIDISGDGDWNNQIASALATCGLMLTVLSPNALRDEAALNERRHFVESGKLIQPIIRRHCDFRESDYWLAPIDFSRDYVLGLHNLLRVLSVDMPY